MTAGTVIDGHCFAVKDASASTTTVQVVRPDDAASTEGHELPDRHGLHEGDVGSGVLLVSRRADTRNDLIGPSAAPSAPTTYAAHPQGPTVTRRRSLKGCRCNEIGFRPRPARSRPSKVTLLAGTWTTYTDDPTGADWNGYRGCLASRCAAAPASTTSGGPRDHPARTSSGWTRPRAGRPHLRFSYSIEFGYSRYMASTGVEALRGVSDGDSARHLQVHGPL